MSDKSGNNAYIKNAVKGKCIIMAAGDFVPVELNIEPDDYVIACDAGFVYLEQMGILPDLILGDFDSLSEKGQQYMEHLTEIEIQSPERVQKFPVKKDDTDTMKAVRTGLNLGYSKLYIYGALGGARLDHTIANLQTLLFIKHHGAVGYIMAHDTLILIAENETINFHKGMSGGLSMFAINGTARGVYEKNLLYELDDAVVTGDFPIGVSNEFIPDKEAQITVENGSLLIIVRW